MFQVQYSKTGTVAAYRGTVKAARMRLNQYLAEFFGVESHEQRLAAAHRGRPRVARRAEQVVEQRLLVRRVVLHVEGDHDFPPSRDDAIHAAHQRERVVPASAMLGRVGLIGDFDIVPGKKLLRPCARLSARPVVVPIQFRRHDDLQKTL